MSGRHSKRRDAHPRIPGQRPPRLVMIIDVRTRLEHLMTDAAASEHLHSGHYPALCGRDVLAASLTDPGHGRCRHCRELSTCQRNGSAR